MRSESRIHVYIVGVLRSAGVASVPALFFERVVFYVVAQTLSIHRVRLFACEKEDRVLSPG